MIMDEEDLAACLGEKERRVLDLPEFFQGHFQTLLLSVTIPEDRLNWAPESLQLPGGKRRHHIARVKDQFTPGILKKCHCLPDLCYVIMGIRHHPDHCVSPPQDYSAFYLD